MNRCIIYMLLAGIIVTFTCTPGICKKKDKNVQYAQAVQAPPKFEEEKVGGAIAVGTAGNDIITFRTTLAGFGAEFFGRFNVETTTGESENDFLFGVKVLKSFADFNRVKVNLFLSVAMETFGRNEQDETRTWETGNAGRSDNLYIRAGFAPELFLAPKLSIEMSFGAQVNTMHDSAAGGDGYTQIATYSSNSSLTGGMTLRAYIF